MTKNIIGFSLIMSGLLSLSACTDDDGIDVADIKVPEG